MADCDEELLRRLIREEIARALAPFIVEARCRPPEDISAKRRRAAQARWAKKADPKPVDKPQETAPETPAKPVDKSVDNPVDASAYASASPKKRRKRAAPDADADAIASSAPTAKVWLAYATAYKVRYGIFPVRNAKLNGMLTQFIKRIPEVEAPAVAEWFVKCDAKLYVTAAHDIALLLRDAEKLRMEWATGRRVNGTDYLSPARPWWEMWSGIVETGRALGIDEASEPNAPAFKERVLRAAAASGKLPGHVAEKLGIREIET